MKYYKLEILCPVREDDFEEWGCGCDMIFHGPAGTLHDPDQGINVVSCVQIDEKEFDEKKNKLFTEEGGI